MLFSYKNAVYCRQTQQVSTPPSSPPIEWGDQDKVAQCLSRAHWIHTEATRPLVRVEAVRWWAQREVVLSIHLTRHCASINKYKRKVFSASTVHKIATENVLQSCSVGQFLLYAFVLFEKPVPGSQQKHFGWKWYMIDSLIDNLEFLLCSATNFIHVTKN